VASFIPFLGRTSDALLTLSDIGEQAATASERLARKIAALPEGVASLAPRDGRIPVETMRSLLPEVHAVRETLDNAKEAVDRLPHSFVLSQEAGFRDLVNERLAQAVPLARSADVLLRALPRFAGLERPARYFLAAQNAAELRGTGGLLGNFAILTLDDGRMSISEFEDIRSLPNVSPSEAPGPNAQFAEAYRAFGGASFWRSLNATPDVPTAATLVESLYERVTGRRLDGTIFVDSVALSHLVKASHGVKLPELDLKIRADDVVRFMSKDAYELFGGRELRGRIQGILAGAIWEGFIEGASGDRALRGLVEAAASGHLLLHSADPSVQSAFRLASIAGNMGPRDGDFFGTVLSNVAANKLDLYLGREVRYDVALAPGGTALANATVTVKNEAPAGAEPSITLGPFQGREIRALGLGPGEGYYYLSLYCARSCTVLDSRLQGRPVPLLQFRERGLMLRATHLRIEPQTTQTIRTAMKLDGVWEGGRAGGTYRLRLLGQPTINPTTGTVVVRAPPGMHVASASAPMEIRGDRAIWHGELSRSTNLEVTFEKGFLGRAWGRILDFLSRPVIRL
jgi:hypothetical protein